MGTKCQGRGPIPGPIAAGPPRHENGGGGRAPEGPPEPLLATVPTGNGPELLKELAGSLGFPAAQEGVQEAQEARPAADDELGEGTGPKKITKQARIKSQGPYARPGESGGGAASRSASLQGTQEEGAPGASADREAEGPEAERL